MLCGPFLHLSNQLDLRSKWPVSVGLVAAKRIDFSATVPFVEKKLAKRFYRYTLDISRQETPTTVDYTIDKVTRTLHIPAIGEAPRIAYFSCNGPSKPEKLWADVMQCHARKPYHLLLGGGDQIYCDDVWKIPKLKETDTFTKKLERKVAAFYFRHYTEHYRKEHFKDALALIPSVMSWDDHDIFDGWGSYDEDFQNSEVFQGIFKVASNYYRLFQQQMSKKQWKKFSGGLHEMRSFGSLALLNIDTRKERSIGQVVSPFSRERIFQKLEELPEETEHLIVAIGLPIIYPSLEIAEVFLNLLNQFERMSVAKMMRGKTDKITDSPELLDDLRDHWKAHNHKGERKALVERFQEFAERRLIRVTFLSGDVHIAAFGELSSYLKSKIERDPRYMCQIVSSGIGSAPPPEAMRFVLDKLADIEHWKQHVVPEIHGTKETMVCGEGELGARFYLNQNWCQLTVSDGYILVDIREEKAIHRKEIPKLSKRNRWNGLQIKRIS